MPPITAPLQPVEFTVPSDVTVEVPDATTINVSGIDKHMLFPAVRKNGPLPRKCFSMGEAHEKRYYMEARSIIK